MSIYACGFAWYGEDLLDEHESDLDYHDADADCLQELLPLQVHFVPSQTELMCL